MQVELATEETLEAFTSMPTSMAYITALACSTSAKTSMAIMLRMVSTLAVTANHLLLQ